MGVAGAAPQQRVCARQAPSKDLASALKRSLILRVGGHGGKQGACKGAVSGVGLGARGSGRWQAGRNLGEGVMMFLRGILHAGK